MSATYILFLAAPVAVLVVGWLGVIMLERSDPEIITTRMPPR
ncbi:hypothetical protein [Roseomonas elaeocarpi]|uniref:Uncharacterized protein n=1 Tax=Roseomonas elaeocarpi TaxID=907779 RepID=A0ABV6K0B6_9PROT